MQGQEPTISVIVAVFKGVGTLQRCIDSVVAQSYPRKELIVIDGGSTDGTVEVIKSNSDNITYWESRPDRGIYHAWNKALNHATGEWVSFVGADDYFPDSDSLLRLAEAGTKVDMVFGRMALVDQVGRVLRIRGWPWTWKGMKRHQVIAHPGALLRRGLFHEYGAFSESYSIAGDYEFFLRLGADVDTAFVDKVVVHAGAYGVSRSKLLQGHREAKAIQSVHPEIGPALANLYYWSAVIKDVLDKSPASGPIRFTLKQLRRARRSFIAKLQG